MNVIFVAVVGILRRVVNCLESFSMASITESLDVFDQALDVFDMALDASFEDREKLNQLTSQVKTLNNQLAASTAENTAAAEKAKVIAQKVTNLVERAHSAKL